MRILNSLYPYPVLSTNDDDYKNGSSFEVEYNLSEGTPFRKAKLSASFNLVDSSIEQLIDSGKAGMFLHVESPRAAYRKMYRVENDFQEIEIEPENMRTLVEVTGLILSTDSIENYSNPNVNEELYGLDYIFPKLEAGDPLAVSFTVEIELDEIDDFAQVASIIKVARTKEKQMRVDYDQDTIFVYLPENQYSNYLKYPSIFGEVMLSSIIQPTLIYVLDAVSRNKGANMQDRKWYQVIEKKLELLGYSMNQFFNEDISSILLTQEILKNPLDRMFLELEGMVGSDD